MQTAKAKQVIKLANLTKTLPKTDNMVKVSSLLSAKDTEFIKEYSVGTICTKIGNEMFFLSPQHDVPNTAQVVRQVEGQHVGQIIGIPVIVGG